jgi:hypothetical protein
MNEPDWWWIDYMEAEADPRLLNDLSELLLVSKKDQETFATFKHLRALIRQTEPHLVTTDRQKKNLHDRIMKAVKAQPRSTETPVLEADATQTPLLFGEGRSKGF